MTARSRLALTSIAVARPPWENVPADARALGAVFNEAVERLRAVGHVDYVAIGLLAHAAYLRTIGDWSAALRELAEVEELAEPGSMRVFFCDCALERTRIALARREAFAPLNGLVDNGPPKPTLPTAAEAAELFEKARSDLEVARKLIADCGYHRRDEELAELDAVFAGVRDFADLPPRV